MVKNYLFIFDFDGTVAQTFEKGPKDISSKITPFLATKDIFGKVGVKILNSLGGLKNRAPSELVHEILELDNTNSLLKKARIFFNENKHKLINTMPEGKGASLEWDSKFPERTIAEVFVRRKLYYSLQQVGTRFPNGDVWPRPCRGFKQFWQIIEEMNKEKNFYITRAILSSGHDLFIKRTFKVWNLSLPDILVTEDDVRWRKSAKKIAYRVKPGLLQFNLVCKKWTKLVELPDLDLNHIIYFGDDINKDKQMAENAQIEFYLYSQRSEKVEYNGEKVFSNWREIGKLLVSKLHE